jgi:hypothetical protein
MTHPSAARESLRWKHEGVNCVPSLRPRLNLGLLHVVPIDCPSLSRPAPVCHALPRPALKCRCLSDFPRVRRFLGHWVLE